MKWHHVHRPLYPAIGFIVILVAWQAYTSLSGITRIALPSPLDILHASIQNYELLLAATWPTLIETLLGFVLALAIGIPLAVCVANSRVLNLALYPILVATQSVPKVAIAPIILVWFGLGMQSKLALAFLVAFFPARRRHRDGTAGDAARLPRARALIASIADPGLFQGPDAGGPAFHLRRRQGGDHPRRNRRRYR